MLNRYTLVILLVSLLGSAVACDFVPRLPGMCYTVIFLRNVVKPIAGI